MAWYLESLIGKMRLLNMTEIRSFLLNAKSQSDIANDSDALAIIDHALVQ